MPVDESLKEQMQLEEESRRAAAELASTAR